MRLFPAAVVIVSVLHSANGQDCCPVGTPPILSPSMVSPLRKFDQFGKSLCIHGDLLIVGEHSKDAGEFLPVVDAGEVQVYRWDPSMGAWQFVQSLVSANPLQSDLFGHDVAMSGNFLVVGANGHDGDDQSSEDIGKAEVFTYDPVAQLFDLELTERLVPSHSAERDEFGHSVAISGTTVMVTSHKADLSDGRVFIFEFDEQTGWNQTQMLDPQLLQGAELEFGWSIAIDGDYAAIGAPGDPNSGTPVTTGPGHVFVYRRDGTNWILDGELVGSDPSEADFFGKSVAIQGTTLVVGEPEADVTGTDEGAAFVYQRIDSPAFPHWQQVGPALVPCDPGRQMRFGWSVAVDRSAIVVGARERKAPELATAGIYRLGCGAWQLVRVLESQDSAVGAGFFGWDVALGSGRVVVTDPRYDIDPGDGEDVGAIYLFSANVADGPTCQCPGDLDLDCDVDIDDVTMLVASWGPCPGCPGENTGNGIIDGEDLQAMLDAFGPCTDQGSVPPPASLVDCLENYPNCPKLCTCIEAVLLLGNGQ